jgi:hypothetical protein
LRNILCCCCCCCCCCCWFFFFFAISNPLSRRVRASRVFWPYSDYGQPASLPLFNRSAELRNILCCCCCCCWFFCHIKPPISLSTGLSRVLALLGRPYSIVPQSCGIFCCRAVISNPLSR